MKPKAADISNERILAIVADVMKYIGASGWDIEERLPEFPPKVVRAKLMKLARRGILEGCTSCANCRGDYTFAGDSLTRP